MVGYIPFVDVIDFVLHHSTSLWFIPIIQGLVIYGEFLDEVQTPLEGSLHGGILSDSAASFVLHVAFHGDAFCVAESR